MLLVKTKKVYQLWKIFNLHILNMILHFFDNTIKSNGISFLKTTADLSRDTVAFHELVSLNMDLICKKKNLKSVIQGTRLSNKI